MRNYFILALVMMSASCTKIDDYMLGKDNTLKPLPLEAVNSQVALVPLWSAMVGKASHQEGNLKIQPVINSNQIISANDSGMVQATGLTKGNVIWRRALPGGISSGPAIKGKQVALITANAKLTVLKRIDGTIQWQNPLPGDALAKPIFVDNKIIVKSVHGGLYAYNASNGDRVWGYDHGAPDLILKASSSPVVSNNQILAGFSDGKIEGIDIASGRPLWTRSVALGLGGSDVDRLIDIDADPIVMNKILYIATYQGNISAISLETGRPIWSKKASIYKNMAASGASIYAVDSNDVIWAFNRHTGKVKWKQPEFKARGLTAPVIAGDQLALGDSTGFVHVLNRKTGVVEGRKAMGASVQVTPVYHKNNLLVMASNGRLTDFKMSKTT